MLKSRASYGSSLDLSICSGRRLLSLIHDELMTLNEASYQTRGRTDAHTFCTTCVFPGRLVKHPLFTYPKR